MISLDYKDKRPLYEQISEKLKELMAVGGFMENSRLPSVRALAVDLSINPNTIQRAYAELERQGYIYSIKGKGNFVAETKVLQYLKSEELKERFSKLVEEAIRLGMSDDEIMGYIERTLSERRAMQ
ncbi:MAG TPA: GntR family transcriptional regulator [Candidatus Avilachnospira avicola]|nr:GntR family transcriptional regulator [Candidatus Avilachnospira avicola]